jgi:predicted nucleotide-binding protein
MTTPTDGEWISAQEALDCLGLGFADGAHAIYGYAFAELVQAKARRFLIDGNPADDDVVIPREFWWRSEEALWQDWRTGHFETTFNDRRFEAFGVQFRRSDIERLKPASAANPSPAPSPVEQTSPPEAVVSRKVFLVHGRDEDARNEVALFLRKIGLEDIVLHQRPNRGRHLHTKFQEEAEGASFAVILMTPDDDGGLVGEPQQRRARQNVVFELGFFIGKLETPHVAAFIGPGVEKPSDFDGICWIEFGRAPKWKIELARELKEAGVPFDSDKILHA